jgi:hypothetical protein
MDERGTVVGFHSSRRAPARAAVREIECLYAELKAIEDRHSNAKEGLRASEAVLHEHLAKAGQRYDQFIFALMNRSKAA